MFADNLNSILRGIIALSAVGNENSERIIAIASVCVLFFALLCLYGLVVLLKCCCRCSRDTTVNDIVILQLVGLLLYMYGNNVNFIVERFAEDLRCNEECVRINNAAGIVCLGIALIILVLPQMCSNNAPTEKADQTPHALYDFVLNMIAIFVVLGALYTTITNVILEVCDTFNMIFTSVFLLLCSLSGLYYMARQTAQCIRECNVKICKGLVLMITISLSLLLYLLADNPLPLNCAFEHLPSGNETLTSFDLPRVNLRSKRATDAVRLVLVVGTLVLNVAALVTASRHQTNNEN